MALVGSAEIIVRAITTKVKDDIQKAFKDARPAIASEGQNAAKDYLDGFKKGLGGDISKHINDAFNSPDVGKAAEDGGKNTGNSFGKGLENALGDIDISGALSGPLEDAKSEIEREIGDGGRRAGDVAEKELGNAGSRGGNSFSKGFLNSDFAKSAEKASGAFTLMLGSSNLLGPAISALVSGISTLISGLFSMASAAGVAAGAVGVLPALMAVAAQSMGALKLAFSGVGAAVTAGFKAAAPAAAGATTAIASAKTAVQDAIKSMGRAQADAATRMADARQQLSRAEVDASQRMADARKTLAKAYQDASDSMATANERVAAAERGVGDAQRDVLVAQRDLNVAREQAVEDMQQLAFSAEGAALAEQRAGLRLQDAHAKLVAAQSLPVDNRARVEAELSFKEAELAYREAKDRNSDLAKEEKKASKAGVDGSSQVVSARKKINDAQGKLADAERTLADERNARAKTERDNQQKIADAQQNIARTQADNDQRIGDARENIAKVQLQNSRAIADAEEALAKARQRLNQEQAKGTTTQNAYNAALAKLSKPAANFVRYLVSIKGEFDKLKTAAGQDLFPKLQTAIQGLVSNVFPTLRKELQKTGSLLGDAALGVSSVFDPGKKNRLGQVLAGNNAILEIFTKRGKGGENTFSKLVRVILRLLTAVQPLTMKFAGWIKTLIDGAELSTRSGKSMEKLTGFFNKAGNRAALVGHIFHNLFKIVLDLGKAADPAGVGLLKSFDSATGALDKFLKTPKQQAVLRKFFKDVAGNMRGIGDLVNTIGATFLGLGDNKGVGKFAESLKPAVKIIGDIADRLTSASPALGPFAKKLAELVAMFTQTSQINTFINTLTKVITVVINIIHWFGRVANAIDGFFKKFTGVDNITGKIGIFVLGLMAVHRALALALIPAKFFFQALTGGPIKVVKAFGKIPKLFSGLTGLFSRLKTAMGLIRAGKIGEAFKLMKGGSDKAKNALEQQMKTDKEKTKVLDKLAKAAQRAAAALIEFKDAAEPLAGELNSIGRNAGKALERGFEEGSTGFTAAMVKLVEKAVKAVKDELGISSPSKVFTKIGEQAGEGYVLGLEEQEAAARAAGARVAAAGAEGAKGAAGGAASSVSVPATGGVAGAEKATSGAATRVTGSMGRMSRGLAIGGKAAGGFGKALKGMGGGLMALTGGPLGLFLIALPLLIKGFIALYKHSPAFRKFIDGITSKLQELGKWLGKIVNNIILPALDAFFGAVNRVLPHIGGVFGKVFGGISKGVGATIDFVKKHWPLLLAIMLGPVGLIGLVVIKNFGHIKSFITGVVSSIVNFVKAHWKLLAVIIGTMLFGPIVLLVALFVKNFGLIKKGFNLLLTKAREILDGIKKKFKELGGKIGDFKDTVGRFFRNIGQKFGDLGGKIRDVVRDIKSKFQDVLDKIRTVVSWIIDHAIANFKSNIQLLGDKVRDVIAGIKGKFDDLKTKMETVKTWLRTKIDDIKGMFGEIGSKVSDVFSKLGGFAKGGINAFIDFLNTKLIDKINSVTKHFGLKIDHIPGLAEGGPVKGQGGPREDNHIRRLSAGEYVIKAASAKALGEQQLNYLNRYGRPPTGMQMSIGDVVGGIAHGAGNVVGGAGHLIGKIPGVGSLEDLFKAGVGKTMSAIVKGTEGLMGSFGLKRGKKGEFSLDNFFYGIMDKLADSVKSWGQKKDDKHAADVAASASDTGGSVADQVIAAGKQLKASKRDILIALITGIVESGLRNLHYGDRDSLGVFQQRAAWGSAKDRTNVAKATTMFFRGGHGGQRGLFDFPNRGLMSLGQAAQAVQVSAFPSRYEQHVREAEALYKRYSSAGAIIPVGNVKDPTRKVQWRGGTFTRKFLAHLQAAEHASGVTIHVTQGGWNGRTVHASGTSHFGDAIDSQVNNSLIKALRNVGIASGDRTGLGNWAPHVHSVPGPQAGYGRGSAPWQWLDYLRRGGRKQSLRSPWGLAKGGIVPATPGGILSIIGEAGSNERVEPLGRDGFSARDRAMIDLIKETLAQRGNQRGDQIIVNPSKGMDEYELASLVSRRVAWKRRPGT